MPFTSSTTAELSRLSKRVDYSLELRTNFAESSTWQAYCFEDFTLTHDANSPATLSANLCNDALDFSNENDPANRVQLFAEVRLICTVFHGDGDPPDNESETLFHGRIYRLEPRDYGLRILAQDWLALVSECECEVSLVPDETVEIAPARQLSLIGGGVFGSVFGFSYSGAGDPAFNEDSDPGTRRRAWAPGNIRLWYDAAATQEVPPKHYQINLTSGAASILEDTAGLSYFASGVRCYIEGTLDWAEVFLSALQYPKADGGIGALFGELDCPDTGLDLAGPLYFRGKVGELLSQVLERQQANLRLWYDSPGGKYTLRVVTQAAAGDEQWSLIHPQTVAQPRELRDVFSRVVVTGLTERPLNALADSAVSITDITTPGDWFAWDGLNVGGDDSFANVGPLMYDGDANRGASVHNLALSENGGSGRYDSWYNCVLIDLGAQSRVSRLRVTMPGSRNANAAAGHQGYFWPGVKLLGSADAGDWRLLSVQLAGRYPPQEVVEVAGKQLLYPKLRYIKVLLGAYKHGLENQDDPSIGLAELEVYCAEEYRVVKEVDGAGQPASYYTYTADYDRDGLADQWQRNHPALWTRLNARHRTRFEDLSGNLNEFLAHDRAIDLLAESVRLFQQVTFTSVCDPRVRLYDTVAVPDELNGAVSGMLVERVVLRPAATEISGTNYRAEEL